MDRGFFPGPEETEASFRARVEAFSAVQSERDLVALACCQKVFGITPDWVPIKEEGVELPFWEIAALWVEFCPQGYWSPSIQVPKRASRGIWKKLLKKEEVLAHEYVHATRCGFQEERFEEILAYQTSSSWLRRFFGPLFRTPIETKLFLWILLGSLVVQWIGVFAGISAFLFAALLPWICLLVQGVRLVHDQMVFAKCLKAFGSLGVPKAEVLGRALRLSDKEIVLMAKRYRHAETSP